MVETIACVIRFVKCFSGRNGNLFFKILKWNKFSCKKRFQYGFLMHGTTTVIYFIFMLMINAIILTHPMCYWFEKSLEQNSLNMSGKYSNCSQSFEVQDFYHVIYFIKKIFIFYL